MPGFVIDKLTSALVRSGAGPIVTVPKATITTRLDAAGQVTLTMPATDPRGGLIVPNTLNYVRVLVDGDTSDVSRIGILKERTRNTQTLELQLRGPNLLDELTFTNVGKLAVESAPGSGLPLAKENILDAILAGTGWTHTGVPSRNVYHRFGDEKTLQALIKLADLTGDHFRLSHTVAREIEWLAAGVDGYVPAASGLIAKETADSSEDACLIVGGLTVVEDGSERITRAYLRGGGNADAQLYVNASTLFGAPPLTGTETGTADFTDGDYTLHKDYDEPWRSYIAHTTNDAAGSIGDVITIGDITPISDTATDEESAANELLQRGLVTLRRRLVDQRSFRCRLTHVDLSRLIEGDSIRVRARVYIDGYGVLNVDEDALILQAPVTFGASEPEVDIQVTQIAVDRYPSGGAAPVQLTAGALQYIVGEVEHLSQMAAHTQPVERAGNVTTQVLGRDLPVTNPTAGQALRVAAGGEFEWYSPAATGDLSAYVAKAGDTMSGNLQLNDTGAAVTVAGMLHLVSNAGIAPKLDVYNDTTTTKPELFLRRARGTAASPTGVLTGNDLGRIAFSGHDTSGFTGARAGIFAEATEDWTTTANGTRLIFQVSATGAETILQPMNLSSVGLSLGASLTPASVLDVNSPTGGIVTISRVDSIVASGDSIGVLQWWNDDGDLTTQKIYGNIEMKAAQAISTDAAAGKLIVRVTGTAAGGAPVEQFNLVDGLMTLKEALNIALGTTTGTKIGMATTGKLAFHGSTPVTQRAGAAQVAAAATAATNTTPYGYSTAAQADAIVTLLNEIRATLVEKGIMKGAA